MNQNVTKKLLSPNIPKDSLLKLIREIAHCMSDSKATDKALETLLKSWELRYRITYNNQYGDSVAYIHIGGSLEKKDTQDNEVLIRSGIISDTTKWLTLNNLVNAFGNYEHGKFDKSKPLPAEPGEYAIFTIREQNAQPIYLNANYYGDNIHRISMKKCWCFPWLEKKNN